MATETAPHVAEMIRVLRPILARRAKAAGMDLLLEDDAYVEEGGWISFIVVPAQPGVKAHEFVDVLNEVEGEFRRAIHSDRVLVVPYAAPVT